MNDPTSVAEQAQRRIDASEKRGEIMTTAKRCAYVTVLILVFLVIGVRGVPNSETKAQEPLTLELGLFEFTLPTMGEPASANTLAGADQELVSEGVMLTRARHKTH
jgi:hypothetical protein